jgi:hypothetical protein
MIIVAEGISMSRWKCFNQWKKKRNISRAQGLVEFAVVLPIILLALFTIIELGRLFHAYLAVENGARFGIRYAVTGEYNPEYCASGTTAEGKCINPGDEVPARVASIHDDAWAGSESILRKGEGEAGKTDPGFFHVTVCKPENLIAPVNPFDTYSCYPSEGVGEPGYQNGKLAAPLFSGTVTVDSTSSGRFSGNVSLSHTTGTGEDRLMLVGISVSEYGTPGVSSATYGGQSLSLAGSYFTEESGWVEGVLIYYLVNPTPGTANVVINYSSAPNGGSVVGVMTFAGVDQNNPLGPFAGAKEKSKYPTVNVSSTGGGLVFDTFIETYCPRTASVGANQTQRWNNNNGGDGCAMGGSTEPGAASVTMSWSLNYSAPWVIGAVAIKPAPDPTATPAASNTPTPTDTPEGTPTNSPTPSITPTASQTQIATATSTPTSTPMTGSSPPDFPACPAGFELIGTYDDYVRRDIEPKSHSSPFSLSMDGDVILSGWVMEGHPDLGCPGHPDCDELQYHEDIIFEIDGDILGVYEDEEHGPYENAYYFFGPMETTLNTGSHTLTFRHTLDGEDAESVGYRYSLCGPSDSTPTPTFTATSTYTPTNTPYPSNTPSPPTATVNPTPTNTPSGTGPDPSIEDPGEPGDRIVVVTEFNHPLILPILNSLWPQLRLTSMREAIVETYFVPPPVGTPPPYDSPTPRPTNTPGPTHTQPAVATSTPTMTSYDPRCDLVWISGTTGSVTGRYIRFEVRAYDWIDWPEVVNYHAIVDQVEIFQDPDVTPLQWIVEGLYWETWDSNGTLHDRYDAFGDDWYNLDFYPDPVYELMHCYGSSACSEIQYRGRLTVYFGQDLQGEYSIFPTVKFPGYDDIICRKRAHWVTDDWITDTPPPGGSTPVDPTASPIPPTEGPPPPTSDPGGPTEIPPPPPD